MSKEQFWVLNIVGGACALLLLLNLIVGRLNEQINRDLLTNQELLNRAQQLQTTIQNLAVRIAQAGRTDAALNALLVRQDLKVTLNEANESTKPKP